MDQTGGGGDGAWLRLVGLGPTPQGPNPQRVAKGPRVPPRKTRAWRGSSAHRHESTASISRSRRSSTARTSVAREEGEAPGRDLRCTETPPPDGSRADRSVG